MKECGTLSTPTCALSWSSPGTRTLVISQAQNSQGFRAPGLQLLKTTHRLQSRSFLGLPYRILNMNVAPFWGYLIGF